MVVSGWEEQAGVHGVWEIGTRTWYPELGSGRRLTPPLYVPGNAADKDTNGRLRVGGAGGGLLLSLLLSSLELSDTQVYEP